MKNKTPTRNKIKQKYLDSERTRKLHSTGRSRKRRSLSIRNRTKRRRRRRRRHHSIDDRRN
jgi:hypothetical protein